METIIKLMDDFSNCPFSSIIVAIIMVAVVAGVIFVIYNDELKNK